MAGMESQVEDAKHTLSDHQEKIQSLQNSNDTASRTSIEYQNRLNERERDLNDARQLLQAARTEVNRTEAVNAELALALQAAETIKATNTSIDRSNHNEIYHLKKLIRKHEKETLMYKELLTTTSR